MASSTTTRGITPGLAEYIARTARLIRRLEYKNKIYVNVRTGSDVLAAAEAFLTRKGIRVRGLSQPDLALRECDKLLRARLLKLADTSRHRTVTAEAGCYVHLFLPTRTGSSSTSYRNH